MELIIFLAGVFLSVILIGMLLEKIRVPWIFSALLIGLLLSFKNPFSSVTSSDSFGFLAELGMYFLLFIIGFELDLKKVMDNGKFVMRLTLAVIFFETLIGTIFLHFLFDLHWIVSLLVASSFATVGEAVLLPILDEFKIVKTKFGQTILSVGALDDLVEIVVIVLASIVIGRSVGYSNTNIWLNILILLSLFVLALILIELHKYIRTFKYKDIHAFFLFVLFLIFLFIGIGQFVESAALGALLAGIALRNTVPEKLLNYVDSEVRTLSYGFFAPLFFLQVGLDTDVTYFFKYPLIILAIMIMTSVTKITTSYFLARKELGSKRSILVGIGLSVKFSTSIVIIKLLMENGLIPTDLFSILIGSMILFKFLVPVSLSVLIPKWVIGKEEKI